MTGELADVCAHKYTRDLRHDYASKRHIMGKYNTKYVHIYAYIYKQHIYSMPQTLELRCICEFSSMSPYDCCVYCYPRLHA